jgi:hypothetical protein
VWLVPAEEWMDEDADEYDAIIFGVWLVCAALSYV